MKKSLFLFQAMLLSTLVNAQDPAPKTWYLTSGGEQIFSGAVLDVNGSDEGSIVRYSGFFNAQVAGNYDFSSAFGGFIGLNVRNIGFIYDVPDTTLRFKFRTYTVGVPVGFKVGSMNNGLFFAGYEIELPVNYKEKKFENEKKEDKFNVWFSDRNEPIYHSVMAGYQFRFGTSIKFKYYLTNFHNEDFTESVDGVEVQPYKGFKANVFYVSLGFGLFKKESFDLGETDQEKRAELF